MKKLGVGRSPKLLLLSFFRVVLIMLTVILVFYYLNTKQALTVNEYYLKADISPSRSSTNNNSTISNDGCGRINNRNSSTWRNLTQFEIDESTAVQICLKRLGTYHPHDKYATAISKIGLNCSTPVNVEILRSTLSR